MAGEIANSIGTPASTSSTPTDLSSGGAEIGAFQQQAIRNAQNNAKLTEIGNWSNLQATLNQMVTESANQRNQIIRGIFSGASKIAGETKEALSRNA
jgi:hypothetical protein